jgi:N-acetylmuramoyl-L-alanine amidase
MCLETNFLRYSNTSITTLDMHNYAGLGAVDGNGRKQALTFPTEEQGVKCHVQHLYAYCSTNPIPNDTLIDPRFQYVTRGIAPNIENLGNGNWASDKQYAEKLLNLLNQLLNNNSNNQGGNVKMKVALRAGHSLDAPGASSSLMDEVTEDRLVYKSVMKYLQNAGVEVVDCTQNSGSVNSELVTGIQIANNSNADIGASIHFNKAYDSYNGAIGSEVWLNPNNSTSVTI